MPKRYDVYLSSTKADLGPERELVAQIITGEHKWRLNHSYSASQRSTLDSCLQDVAESAVYLCVVGRRYGTLAETGKPDDPCWSYTQHEYERAVELGLPRFVLFKDGGFDDFDRDIDRDATRIDAFRARIQAPGQPRPAVFKNPEQLRAALSSCRADMQDCLDKAAAADAAARPPANTVAYKPWVAIADQAFARLPVEPAARWAHVQMAVAQALRLPPLVALQSLWEESAAAELSADGVVSAASAINRWTGVLEDFTPSVVGAGAVSGAGRAEAATVVMKLLFAMALAPTAWKPGAWLVNDSPVHFELPELMAAARSLSLGRNFDLGLEQTMLKTDWLLDLTDGPEFGAGIDRYRQLQDQIAGRFAYAPQKARSPDGRFSDQDRRRLASHVRNRQDIALRVYVVSEAVLDGRAPDPVLRAAVEELRAHAIPRCCQPTHLLRDDEYDLEDAVCQCLTAIGKLP
jgi:hypothetical protein